MGALQSGIQPDLINIVLPPEILRQIFSLLPPADLRSLLLVCQLWREVGESPGLWTWAMVRATRLNMNSMPKRLAMRKMMRVGGLTLEAGVEMSEELLETMDRHPGLRRMVVRRLDMALVRPARLTGLLNRLTAITFIETELTPEQLLAIFTSRDRSSEPWSRKKQGPLTFLDLTGNDLSIIEPKLLASVVNKLQYMVMKNSYLKPEQVNAVLISTSVVSSLQGLDIGHNNLSSVEPKLLARAVTKIKDVRLNWARLSLPQIEAILDSVNKGTQLKKLSLRGNVAAPRIQTKLLIDALDRLEEMDLALTRPTLQQACAVLMALKDCTDSWSLKEIFGKEEKHLIYKFVRAKSPILTMDFSFRQQLPYQWLFTKLNV